MTQRYVLKCKDKTLSADDAVKIVRETEGFELVDYTGPIFLVRTGKEAADAFKQKHPQWLVEPEISFPHPRQPGPDLKPF